MVGEGIERQGDSNLSVTAVKTEQNMTSFSAASRVGILSGVSETSPLCSHVVILNTDGHQLTRDICEVVANVMAECRLINSIEYYPMDGIPVVGGRTPDVVIRLASNRVSSLRLPFYQSMSANAGVFAGDSYSSAVNCATSSTEEPLIAGLLWQGRLSHKSRTFGYEFSSRSFEHATRSMGEKIGEGLIEQFSKLQAENGPLNNLPGDFFGSYQKTPKMPFVERDDCRLVSSTAGLFHFNRTVWWLSDDRETATVLAEIHEQLLADGWEGFSLKRINDDKPELRMHRGDEWLIACRRNESISPGTQFIEQDDSPPVLILYEKSFGERDRNRALVKLLDSGVNGTHLLWYEAFFAGCDSETRERYWSLINENSPSTISGQLAVIKHHLDIGSNETASMLLRNAVMLAWVRHEYEDYRDLFEKLAKGSGDMELVHSESFPELTPEIVAAVGFAEWTDQETPEVHKVVGVDEPFLLLCRSTEGETIAVCAKVQPGNYSDPNELFDLWCGRIHMAEHPAGYIPTQMSMVGNMSGDFPDDYHGRGSVYWNDRSIDIRAKSIDKDRFRISAKLANW